MPAAASVREPINRIIWQPSPPCPTACETDLPVKGGQGHAGTKPACVQNFKLWELRRPNFSGLNSGLSQAKLCRDPAVPLEAARQPLSPPNPFLYEAKPHPGHEWVKDPWWPWRCPRAAGSCTDSSPARAVRGSARLSCPFTLPLRARLLSAAAWVSWKAKPRHENHPHVCLKGKLLDALLQSLPECYKKKGSAMYK